MLPVAKTGVLGHGMSSMSDRPFLDTNVLVYAFDRAYPEKQQRAWDILEGRVFTEQPTISTQIIGEFYVTVVRKLSRPLSEEKALEACAQLALFSVVQIDTEMVLSAVRLSQRHGLSYWDSLIIEAARMGGCNVLVTEDLQDGFQVEKVSVVNPFIQGR